jgi:hypothetical protein
LYAVVRDEGVGIASSEMGLVPVAKPPGGSIAKCSYCGEAVAVPAGKTKLVCLNRHWRKKCKARRSRSQVPSVAAENAPGVSDEAREVIARIRKAADRLIARTVTKIEARAKKDRRRPFMKSGDGPRESRVRVDTTSKSVHIVQGGLPSLGKRR